MYLIPGFLVPVVVSIGLSLLFLSPWLSSQDEYGLANPQGAAEWVAVAALTTALVIAFHIFRSFVPIPRGGFFWQAFVIVTAFVAAGIVSGAMGDQIAGLVALLLLTSPHILRLGIEDWWAARHVTS